MNQFIYEAAVWLDDTAWSTSIHESFYLYNWIETAHVLSLTFSLGLLFFIDFRILGLGFTKTSAPLLASKLKLPMWFGFAVMFLTGFLLLYAIPVRTAQSIWFRVKLLLLVAALINAHVFHRALAANSVEPFSPGLRRGAMASIIIWVAVVVCGRLIAYDWFDCVQQPNEFVRLMAGCIDGQEQF